MSELWAVLSVKGWPVNLSTDRQLNYSTLRYFLMKMLCIHGNPYPPPAGSTQMSSSLYGEALVANTVLISSSPFEKPEED